MASLSFDLHWRQFSDGQTLMSLRRASKFSRVQVEMQVQVHGDKSQSKLSASLTNIRTNSHTDPKY